MSRITLIGCHGTDADFKGFDLSECNDSGAFGRGFYFSNDMELERQYSSGLDPVVAKVTLQNPYIVEKTLPYDGRMMGRLPPPGYFGRSSMRERD
ncbi:hypothetical protein [Phyllobacterium endophyticum]|uniref:hypothetical protein n=1 Tax=Phyllobacterium endophyticum TaxID=1149773 RepID=UPI0011C98854|nr:hypothetical protein [Phyllobacterium endophyticum]TXR47026.1 hypothetical protein FVA77_22175 [Phyllobacterium endophyticum]